MRLRVAGEGSTRPEAMTAADSLPCWEFDGGVGVVDVMVGGQRRRVWPQVRAGLWQMGK